MPAKVRLTSSVAVGQYGAEVVAMGLSRKKAILSSHLRSPSTRSSSECGSSSLDDAVAPSFTSSTKRALYGLQTTLESFATTLHAAFTQPIPINVSPINVSPINIPPINISLPPLSQCDPRSSAAQRLQKSFDESSASEGGAWLSQQEFYEGLSLIRADSAFSTIYVSLSEDASRGFLRMQLEQARTARASAPGGSDP
jgi:hypothetical protein